MRIDRVVVQVVRITPHLVTQLRSRQHALWICGEHREQVELGHGEQDLLVADLHATRGVVDLQGADAEDALTAGARLGQRRTPQVRVDPGREDARVERLGDVVVGANLETDDLVHLGRPAGQHDHRAEEPLTAQLADDLSAADVRQHPVDQHEVWLGARGQLDRLRAGRRFERLVALELADLGDEHPDWSVVLDHENAPLAARGRGGQLCFGGANPTRRDSCAERLGLRIRRTRFSPPSITSVRSQPSAPASFRSLTNVTPSTSWATVRTCVENSHSRMGSPTVGTIPEAAAPSPGWFAWSGSSGAFGGGLSGRGARFGAWG